MKVICWKFINSDDRPHSKEIKHNYHVHSSLTIFFFVFFFVVVVVSFTQSFKERLHKSTRVNSFHYIKTKRQETWKHIAVHMSFSIRGMLNIEYVAKLFHMECTYGMYICMYIISYIIYTFIRVLLSKNCHSLTRYFEK